MRKLIMVAIAATLSIAAAVAQPRAIGAQLGYGVEFSYEHSLGNNFLSLDAGFPGFFSNRWAGAEAAVTYNWLNPFGADFPQTKGDWNWYMGVGAGVGVMFQHDKIDGHHVGWHNHGYFGAAGRIGVEYNFWFPLQLSVEWRPIIGPRFCSYTDANGNHHTYEGEGRVDFHMDGLYAGGLSLGVRYLFH